MKILAICGNGMGTSLVIKMKVKKFLEKSQLEAEVLSCSLGEANGYLQQNIDIALCSKNLVSALQPPLHVAVIGLVNLMDEKEYGPKILELIKTKSLK